VRLVLRGAARGLRRRAGARGRLGLAGGRDAGVRPAAAVCVAWAATS